MRCLDLEKNNQVESGVATRKGALGWHGFVTLHGTKPRALIEEALAGKCADGVIQRNPWIGCWLGWGDQPAPQAMSGILRFRDWCGDREQLYYNDTLHEHMARTSRPRP